MQQGMLMGSPFECSCLSRASGVEVQERLPSGQKLPSYLEGFALRTAPHVPTQLAGPGSLGLHTEGEVVLRLALRFQTRPACTC